MFSVNTCTSFRGKAVAPQCLLCGSGQLSFLGSEKNGSVGRAAMSVGGRGDVVYFIVSLSFARATNHFALLHQCILLFWCNYRSSFSFPFMFGIVFVFAGKKPALLLALNR